MPTPWMSASNRKRTVSMQMTRYGWTSTQGWRTRRRADRSARPKGASKCSNMATGGCLVLATFPTCDRLVWDRRCGPPVGGPPLAVAARSQGRCGRTSVKRGAVACDVVARGRRSVTNLGRLSQRVTGGCDRFFWLVTRGSFFLSHCHTFSLKRLIFAGYLPVPAPI